MELAQYFTEFILYSFLGWIWESVYCTIREKGWQDRGFLFGPICPIYGISVVLSSYILKNIPVLMNPDFPLWGIFILCFLVSAIIEYGTSWGLEKRFHARWWDYSDIPLNINGRICMPASIGFGMAGVFIVKYLIPAVENVRMMVKPGAYELLALIFAIILGADLALTEASLSSLLKRVEEMHLDFNEKAQVSYEKISSAPKVLKRQIQEAMAYTLYLDEGQRSVLKKIIPMPNKRMSEEQNLSRITFIHNLKEAVMSLPKNGIQRSNKQ